MINKSYYPEETKDVSSGYLIVKYNKVELIKKCLFLGDGSYPAEGDKILTTLYISLENAKDALLTNSSCVKSIDLGSYRDLNNYGLIVIYDNVYKEFIINLYKENLLDKRVTNVATLLLKDNIQDIVDKFNYGIINKTPVSIETGIGTGIYYIPQGSDLIKWRIV